MLQIEKIKLHELSDFFKSDKFSQLKSKPISSLRVASYLKNPNAKLDDVVLYMAFKNNELIGYRTIWRDVFYENNIPKYFGWLSGNWVNVKNRREGVSTALFNEVYKDWKGELMYTNYADASKLLYDKTNFFVEIQNLKGTRFYTRFCLIDILPKKKSIFKKLKFLWLVIDFLGNIFINIKLSLKSTNQTNLKVIKDEVWNHQISSFLKLHKKDELFKRDEIKFKWVQNYPWLQNGFEEKKESKNYYFSLSVNDFQNNYYTFYDEVILKGFLWLNIKDKHLKVTYAYFEDEILDDLINFIINIIISEKVKTVLIYDSKIEKELINKMSFITKKIFFQRFFASKKIVDSFSEIKNKKVQSGDGDVIFT